MQRYKNQYQIKKKSTMLKKYFFVILLGITVLTGCETETEDNYNSNVSNNIDTVDVFESIKKVYYSLPSPMEIASVVKKSNTDLNPDAFSSTSNNMNYTTTKAQAINIGIYAADLAFVSLFDQKQYSTAIFQAILELAEEMEILEGLNDTLITKVHENLENPDELKDIIAEAFFKSDAYLKESGREKVATYIMVGAWVESYYLMTDMAIRASDTTLIYQIIIDQRLVLDNVIKSIEIQGLEEDIINSLTELNNQINTCVIIEKKEVVDPYTDSLRTKTIVKYNYSSNKIEKIYKKISKIRKKFVSLQ